MNKEMYYLLLNLFLAVDSVAVEETVDIVYWWYTKAERQKHFFLDPMLAFLGSRASFYIEETLNHERQMALLL